MSDLVERVERAIRSISARPGGYTDFKDVAKAAINETVDAIIEHVERMDTDMSLGDRGEWAGGAADGGSMMSDTIVSALYAMKEPAGAAP